ncbi:MAG: SDR family oxidoreductase [Woeseiaceae bacterium]|nr:SDR family oxidoreductase [Woeseiaceae bacterium]
MNRYDIKDLVILITGAAGQLGQSTINAAIVSGAKVVCLDLCKDALTEASKKNDWNDNAFLCSADITNQKDIKEALNLGLEHFGKIDALINNAGVSIFSSWQERNEEDFDWVTSVNLKGNFLCTREYLKYLIKTKVQGSIVNVASFYGVVSPDPRIYTDCDRRNSEVYGATKAGVIQMTKYFAVNGVLDGANVRVNGVAPGGIRNALEPQGDDFQKLYADRCPLNRMAEVEEIVGPMLFLISSDSSYINGQTIIIDGGTTAW